MDLPLFELRRLSWTTSPWFAQRTKEVVELHGSTTSHYLLNLVPDLNFGNSTNCANTSEDSVSDLDSDTDLQEYYTR